MKTILITGGAGFIGSHLTDKLLQQEHKVICFDSFDNLYNPALKWKNVSTHIDNPDYTLISGSITDPDALIKAFSCRHIDAVVHLAALAGIRASIQDPVRHFNTNIQGTVNVLEMCRKDDIEKFVFASSSSVYGNSPLPFKEDYPVNMPLCPYAASKRAGELLCYVYHHIHTMDIACIRPFTVYGPRQRINMAIPLFVQLINEGKSITVHGMDTFRDFTYINDVVSGIMNILGIYHGYQIYNLGSGKPVKLKELIAHIEQRLSKKAIISYSSLMSGEATNTLADITKARDAFDYDPQFSIEQGLDLYISWYLKESGRAL